MKNPNRYKFTKDDQVAGGRVVGAKTLAEGTGIHSQTPEQRLGFAAAGGRTGGKIQGPANVASGQWDRIRNSPAAVEGRLEWARSEENKTRCSEMGKKQAANVDWSRVKNEESLRLGGVNSTGRHVRWHVNRRMFNLACPFCLEAIARKENWGIEVFEPEN